MSRDEEPSLWSRAKAQAGALGDQLGQAALRAGARIQELDQEALLAQAQVSAADLAGRVMSTAAGLRQQAGQLGDAAQQIAKALALAGQHAEEPEALLANLSECLSPLAGQIDGRSQAVAVGYLASSGAGTQPIQGSELFFLRADGPARAQLRFQRIFGRYRRLSVGASAGAYLMCAYGPREGLARAMERRGKDAGLSVASLSVMQFYLRGQPARETSAWALGLSAGLSLGLPLISDFAQVELQLEPEGHHPLSTAQSDRIEALLADAPDRGLLRRLSRV